MDQLLEAIRNATATGATDEARAAGAQACRTLLTALEAKPGEALASPAAPDSPIATIVAGLRGVPVDQLLDLAIAKLRTMVPADAVAVAQAPKISIPLIQVPRR